MSAAAEFKPLVLCADDYAANPAISAAILELARRGRLSATSVMVLSPRWAEQAPALAELRARLDVGLHLDWTSPFARQAGHGLSLGAAMRRALLGGFGAAAARAVIERQLDAFETMWRGPPDHVDGHQHVQQFSGIRAALVEVLARRYPQRPPWLRVSAQRGGGDLKSRVVAALGARALAAQARARGIGVNPDMRGFYGFQADPGHYPRRMAAWLRAAGAGTLLMCHPATAALPDDDIGPARVREFEYLASADFGAALARAGWRVERGSRLYG